MPESSVASLPSVRGDFFPINEHFCIILKSWIIICCVLGFDIIDVADLGLPMLSKTVTDDDAE